MSARRAAGFVAMLMLALAGCVREPHTERHAFFALGTLVEISVHAPPDDIDAILRDVETALLAEEQRWHAWETGTLAELNRRLAAGESVEPDAKMLAGIERAREISERSGGRFNPAIGRTVEAWGFHVEERAPGPPPNNDALAAFLPPPELAAIVPGDDGRWHSSDPRLWIDMGAFAKGLAVEVAIDVLRRHRIDNAIVNAGGDLKVIGRHGERAWRIGVRNPRGDGMLAAISASGNESVFTSGDYERFFEWNGVRYHHILDPATALPARGVTSVTVVHADAALADAAATALFVAGEDEWPAVARALGVEQVMVVLADGRIQLTPAMRARIEFETATPAVETVSP